MRLKMFLSIRRSLGQEKYAFRPTEYTSIKFAKNEIFPKGRGGKKNLKNLKKFESPKMHLEVFLSIRRTLGHQKYAFRPTKYTCIKFAKNEIFPKRSSGENISKNLFCAGYCDKLIKSKLSPSYTLPSHFRASSQLCMSNSPRLEFNDQIKLPKSFQ